MSNQYLACVLSSYTDSGFTNPHQMVQPDDPLPFEDQFTHMGAQCWGLETDRHGAFEVDEQKACFHFDPQAHHTLQITLDQPSLVREIRISTQWYTGNHVHNVSVEMLLPSGEKALVLDRVALQADQEHVFSIDETLADGCYVRCYHEGGIARINLYGEPAGPADSRPNLLESVPISHVSNEHYGQPSQAVAGVRKEDHMIGWESARMGFGEQAVFHLSSPATIDELVVDTYLHRLNPPLSCHLFGLPADEADAFDEHVANLPQWTLLLEDGTSIVPDDFHAYMTERRYLDDLGDASGRLKIVLATPATSHWLPLLEFARLYPDRLHRFTDLMAHRPVSHLLYLHFPNGGVHGLRVHGTKSGGDEL